MINTNIFISIFKNYDINKVILLKDNETYNFIISEMPSSMDIERWDFLEHILFEATKQTCNILSFSQAVKLFGEEKLRKSVVIKQ